MKLLKLSAWTAHITLALFALAQAEERVWGNRGQAANLDSSKIAPIALGALARIAEKKGSI